MSADTWAMIWEPCKLCRLRNRTGAWIVAAVAAFFHLFVLLGLLLAPDVIGRVILIPNGGQQAILLHTGIGLILSAFLLYGICLNNIYLCLPWTFYGGISLLLNFFALIFFAIFGLPVPEGESVAGKVQVYITMFLIFGMQVYLFWVILSYVLELKDNKTSYEHFPDPEDSRSGSRKRKSRSPIFKIIDDGD